MELDDNKKSFLRSPPTGENCWPANGPLQQLVDAGFLRFKPRKVYRPAVEYYVADFERTEMGDAELAKSER